MGKLNLVLFFLMSFTISSFSQSARMLNNAPSIESKKAEFVEYLNKWTPRLEEAISIKDHTSVEAIVKKVSEDVSVFQGDLKGDLKNQDQVFLTYMEQVQISLSSKETYKTGLYLMKQMLSIYQ